MRGYISVLTFNQGLRPLRPSVGPRQNLRFILYSADVVGENQRVQTALKKNKDVARCDSENEDRQSDDNVEEIKEPCPKKV